MLSGKNQNEMNDLLVETVKLDLYCIDEEGHMFRPTLRVVWDRITRMPMYLNVLNSEQDEMKMKT